MLFCIKSLTWCLCGRTLFCSRLANNIFFCSPLVKITFFFCSSLTKSIFFDSSSAKSIFFLFCSSFARSVFFCSSLAKNSLRSSNPKHERYFCRVSIHTQSSQNLHIEICGTFSAFSSHYIAQMGLLHY